MAKKQRDYRPFIGLHKELIFGCPQWARLAPRSKDLYLIAKGKYNPLKNEGKVKLSYREVKRYGHHGLRRNTAISEAFHELEIEGWLERANPGGLFGQAQEYWLTWRFDKYGRKASK